jgi:hypothetical protein
MSESDALLCVLGVASAQFLVFLSGFSEQIFYYANGVR